MKGYCDSCGRALKEIVAVVKFGAGPEKVKVCKSPICQRYMQPQENE